MWELNFGQVLKTSSAWRLSGSFQEKKQVARAC